MRAEQKGRFEPSHDAHAIEQVAIVVQFCRQLDDEQLTAAVAAAGQFKDELPGAAELPAVAIALGAIPVMPRLPNPLGGRIMNRMRPDGVVESELRMERTAIVFRTTTYTRWADFWGQTRRYFEALLPIYAPAGEIGAVGLNYVDKFYWDGLAADIRPALLLRQGSRYVSPYIYEAGDLWHSHVGAFVREDQYVKRLVNINLDCSDESRPTSRRVIAITTVLTDMLNQPGYRSITLAGSTVEFFSEKAEQLHADSKRAFAEVIDEQMCRRIALTE